MDVINGGPLTIFRNFLLGVGHMAPDAGGGRGSDPADEESHQESLLERGQGGPVRNEQTHIV